TIAYLISRSLQPVPIFELLTAQDGLELPSMEEQREQPVPRVEDAMRPANLPMLGSSFRVNEAIATAESEGAEHVLVDDRPHGWAGQEKVRSRDTRAPNWAASGRKRIAFASGSMWRSQRPRRLPRRAWCRSPQRKRSGTRARLT